MVRAGEGGLLFEEFKKHGIVAIGWDDLGDLSQVQSEDEIWRRIEEEYPDEKTGWKAMTASQVSRFRFDFKEGDHVVTYDPESREYLVGSIAGPYCYDDVRKEYQNIRKVEWMGTVKRDKLSTSSRNTLGAISTIFDVGEDVEREMMNLLTGRGPTVITPQQEEQQLVMLRDDIVQKAREFIKDRIIKLEWSDAQRLLAGVLQAMGYRARISPLGPDRGRDVEASRDGLGLDEPRIIVQVKHRAGQMNAQDVRSFIAGLRQGHKGLYVSTGGFTKDARYEADRSNIPLTLVDLDGLIDLIIQSYDNFDAESRLLIPLTKIYWPK